jgi:hypothetical protein
MKSERTALDNFLKSAGARHEELLRLFRFEDSGIEWDLKLLSQHKDPQNLAEIEAENQEVLAEIAATAERKRAKKALQAKGKKGLQTQWAEEIPDTATVSATVKIKRQAVLTRKNSPWINHLQVSPNQRKNRSLCKLVRINFRYSMPCFHLI